MRTPHGETRLPSSAHNDGAFGSVPACRAGQGTGWMGDAEEQRRKPGGERGERERQVVGWAEERKKARGQPPSLEP